MNIHSLTDEQQILDLIQSSKAIYIQYINPTMISRDLYIKCIKIKAFCMNFITNEFKDDIDFLLEAYTVNHRCLTWINYKYKNNENFMLKCITINSFAINFIPTKLSKKNHLQLRQFQLIIMY